MDLLILAAVEVKIYETLGGESADDSVFGLVDSLDSFGLGGARTCGPTVDCATTRLFAECPSHLRPIRFPHACDSGKSWGRVADAFKASPIDVQDLIRELWHDGINIRDIETVAVQPFNRETLVGLVAPLVAVA